MTFRIGLDARFAVRKRRGIGNYTLELIRALVRTPGGFEYFLFTDSPDHEGVLPKEPPFHQVQLRPGLYPLWEQVSLPLACRTHEIDLLHCLGMTAPLALPSMTQLVASIHDVIYMLPSGHFGGGATAYQAAGRMYRKFVIPWVAQKANHIITISEFSGLEIRKVFPGVPASKITVTPLAVSTSFSRELAAIGAGAPEDVPYFLHLGGEDPRKNTLSVITAFLRNRHRFASDSEALAIAGLGTEGFARMVTLLPPDLREVAREAIRLTGFISEADLVRLYRNATALLFPSKFEGFGIPVLEGMACGVPVITSSTTSLVEVAGGAALLVNPESPYSLSEAMVKISNDSVLRANCISAGLSRAAAFSWDHTRELTQVVYEKVLHSR